MKLKRVMHDGHVHLFGSIDGDDWRDITADVGDLDAAALGGDILTRIADLDLASCAQAPEFGDILPCIAGVGKFMCIGLNYSDHAEEAGMPIPAHPILFLKANSAIAGAQDDIVLPRGSVRADWEVELGVVVGTTAKYVTEAEALSHVAGYCVVNDLSERSFQLDLTGQWTKGKSCDGFGPLGPWFVTADEVPDPQNMTLWVDVNGQRMQDGHTGKMIFSVAQIISHLSELMTLHPGDVIATGTPPGVGMGQTPQVYLKPGDIVEAGVNGLGSQCQKVLATPEPSMPDV